VIGWTPGVDLNEVVHLSIERPGPSIGGSTRVVDLYPTSGLIPLNQLRFYVYFSAAMSEGWAGEAVKAFDAGTAEPLSDVFLPMEPELWDRGHRRLTVLLDPGRIKRGLAPNKEVGYPLADGAPIILSVSRELRDARGLPLVSDFDQRYEVGPAVRRRIDPGAWGLQPPSAGTRVPLELSFDRPLDHALLGRCITVLDASGSRVTGKISTGPGERSWRYVPLAPWSAGPHQVIVEPILEDTAGNSIIRVFDRDLSNAEDDPVEASPAVIRFDCVPL